jgi:hypothetical protein
MLMHQGWRRMWFMAVVLLIATTPAWAAPIVLFAVDDVGGGLFQYSLLVKNTEASEPLSGLTVLKGHSVFDLDDTSAIGGPQNVGGNPAADWSFLPPVPSFVDELNYFSLHPDADVPIDGSLAGFFFLSMTHPSTISGDDFAVEGIGAISASQIDLGTAQPIPEPSTLLLLCSGLAGSIAFNRTRRSRT